MAKRKEVSDILEDVEAATFSTENCRDMLADYVSRMAIGQVIPFSAMVRDLGMGDTQFRKLVVNEPRLVKGTYTLATSGRRATAYRRVK